MVVRVDRDLRRVRVDVLGLRGVRPQVAVEAVVLAPDAGAGQLVGARGRRELGLAPRPPSRRIAPIR